MSNTRLKTSITKQFNSQIKELKLGIAEKKRLFELFEDFIAWKHNFGAWSESEVDDFISTRRDKISPNLSQHLKNYIRHSSFDEIQVFLLEFLDNLAAKKTTKKTIRNYRSDIKQFIRSAKSTAVAKLLTREKLDKFVEAQVKKGLKSSSINRKLSSITRFAQFIEEELIVKNDLSWLTGHKYKPLQIKTSVKPSPFSGEGPLASAREGEATAGKVKTFGLTSLVPPTAGLEFLSTSGKRSNTTPGMTLDELPLTNLSTGEDFKKSRISHETLNSKAKITQAQAAQIKQLKKANFFKAAILSLVVLFLFSFQSMTDFANTQLTQTKTGNFISRTIENISQPWNWLTNKQNESDKNYLTQAKRGNILGAKEDLTKSKLLFHIPTNFNAAVEVLNLSIAETLDVTGDSDLGGDLTVDGDTTLAGDTSLQSNLQVDGDTNVDGNLTVAGTTVLTGDTTLNATTINGVLTLTQDISADGIDIDLGDGELTAGNVIYSLTAGTGITVTSDQTPTISVTSAANAANLEVWSTIDANGTELTAGSNDDTLELAVADNITITGSGDTITFGADNVFGWTDTGTTVSLLTATDKVGIGTASPTAQLQIGAGTPSNADGADDVYIAGDLEVATGIYVSDGGLVDFSNIAQDDTSPQGVKFPQNTSASLAAISGGGEGYLAWSTDGDKFQQFDGTNWTDLATGGSTEWTDAGTYLHPDETNDTLGVGGTTLAAADIVLGSDGSAIFNEQSNSVDFRIESNDQEAIFFVDGDTNRIGIGSTSPDDVLDVVGTIDISSGNTYQINNTDVLSSTTLGSSVVTSSLTTVGVLNSGSITSGFGNIDIGSSNLDADGTITFAGISDGLVKSTSGVLSAASEGTDYEGPLTFTNGLTESSQTVRWGGALTENTTITLDSTETLDFANTGTGNITYNLTSTGDFDIQDNGTSAFYVKDDGNVGIGTTTPQSLLHVGSTGTPGSIDGTDDLYVYDDLEVDGSIYGTVAGTLINTAADSGTSTLNHGDTLAINGDNSGIDSSLSGDTYTLSFDSTEVGDTTTWGSGSAFTWTFDSTGGTDPSITFGDNTISFNAADITTVSGNVDVEGYMAVGNGSGLSANSGLIVDYDTTYTNVGQQLLVLGTVTGAANQNIYGTRIDPESITVPAGTTSLVASLYVDEPNLTATGTVTDAASLYIAGAATEGSSGNYALWVDSGATQLDGALTLGTTGTDGNLTIYSEQGSTDYSVVLQPNSSMTQTTTYTLPADDGSSNQVLASDGSGNLSWINVSAGAGNSWSTTGSSPDVTYLTDLTSDFALGAIGTTAPLYFDESASALTLNPYGTGTGNVGEIRMTELIANGTNYTGFKAPDTLGADYIYTLPTDDGEADQVLASNGSGNLDWIDISAGAGGLWIDGGDYVYIAGTYASYIGNTAADGANKLAGAFFEDDASLVLGSTNDFTLAYDATTDNRLELSANNQEFSIDLGNQDLVLAGSAEGTAALTLTAGDLTVTDGDLTISSGETSFATNSTADTSKALTVSHSGNITGTGYGIYSTVTGTSTANIAGYFNSSGATSNYGLLADAATGDIVGSAANAGDLLLISTTDSTKGDIQFHSSSYYVNSSGQMILNTDETLNGIDVNSGAISDVTQLTLNNNDPSIIFDVTTATDTDFWLGVQDDAGGDDDDKFMIGDGATPGTNSFLTIDTSGQVGIGTTSPTTDLQISDGSSVNMWLDPQAASHSNPFFAMNNVSSNRLQMFFHDGASTNNWARGFVLQSYVAGRGMTFAIPNSSDFRITASNTGNSATTDPIVFLVNNSGDVGIGNSSPSYRLDVNSSTTDEVARFLSSDDLAQILISDDDTTGYLAAKDSTLSIGLTSGLSTSNINIDTSGNVGIGTTAPSQELTVYNDTVIGGSTSLTETLDNSGFSLGGDDLFVAGTAGIEGDVYTDGSFIAGSTLTLNDAYIRDSADLNLQADGDTDDYIILDTTSNEAAILFENATKAYTNDPGIKINGTTGKLEYRDEDESTWTAIDTVIPFTNSASPDVTYLTDTTEYLGIGLTSPGYSLEVNHATDDILAEFESGDALAGIQITDSSDTAYLLTQDATLSLGMTNSLSSSNLNIDSSGQVGIGVTNPLSTLNVYSASGSDVTFSLDDGDVANPFTTIANYTANQFFVVDPLSSTDGGAKVTGASDGDAIGLKLRGLIGSDTVSNHIPAVQILGGRHDGAGDIQGLATGDIIFQVTENGGDGSFFNIQGNGDVGIGTTNPTTPLHVYDSDGGHAVKLDVGSGNAWLEFSEAGTQRWVMGNNSTQSDRFYVLDQDNNQGVYMAQNTTAWVANSDSRLKENISTENNILDKVSQMRAVSYNFIGNNPSKKEIGVIAQEIEPYFPEVVDTDAEYWGVSYSRLGAIALGGLKEQYELFQDQQNQVNILSTDLNSQLSTHDTQLSDIANQLVTQDERLTTNESLITTLETNLSAIEEELTTNRLAIGTTASSELAMAVEQANIDTAIALLSNSDASASADVLELQVGATIAGLDNAFVTFKNGLGDVIGKITGNETGGVTYSTSGADFAEYFPKVNPDEKLEPGDIVCLHSLGGIKKCGNSSLSGEANIIGVVSEHAGFVGNSEHADNPNYALVGILGQLPVKISTDANIQPGDAITIGSDGKAIKATSAGYIVGKALEKPLLSGSAEDGDQIFSPKGESTVLTYINPSYYIGDLTANGTLTSSHDFSSPPDGEELESESLQSEDARGEADLFTRLENSLKTSLGESVDENKISDLETELSELKEQIAMITEKITEETELPDNRMLIGDTVVEVDAYGEVLGTSSTDQPSLDLEDLPADRQGKFEFFETLAEKNQIGETESAINETETLELNSESNITLLAELFKIDEDGNIAVAGNLDVEGSVSTQKLQISESSPEPSPDLEGKTENTSLGSATLAAGETSVLVKTTALSENSKIFTSLTSESGNQSLIVKIHDDSSFKVSIENKHSENITFDWWIVDAIKKTNKTLEEGLRLASPSAGINY